MAPLFVLSFSLLCFYPSNPFIMASHQPHPVLLIHRVFNFCVSTCIVFYRGPNPPPPTAAPPDITILVPITWNLLLYRQPTCQSAHTPSPPHPPSSPPAPPFPTDSSPHPWKGWDGRPQQQDPEDHRLWTCSRVAPHHQDERRRHLRLDGSRSHPLIYVLQG